MRVYRSSLHPPLESNENSNRNGVSGFADIEIPQLQEGQCLIRVRAAGVNGAGALQIRGLYPPPPGESDILGLEFAGEVIETSASSKIHQGRRVMGLVPAGAYAEYLAVWPDCCVPIPEQLDFIQAATLPEAYFTALHCLNSAAPPSGSRLLVYGAAGGLGSAITQLARHRGFEVIGVARGLDRVEASRQFGAHHTLDRGKESNLGTQLKELGIKEVQTIFDMVGAASSAFHLDILAAGGTLLVIGLLGGSQAQFNLGQVLKKRIKIEGISMRSLNDEKRVQLCETFCTEVLPLLSNGQLLPCLGQIFPFAEAEAALELMLKNQSIGKIVLEMN